MCVCASFLSSYFFPPCLFLSFALDSFFPFLVTLECKFTIKNSFIHAQVTQSCLTLCDPMDCSPPGFPVHEISWAKILEWVAVSFSGELNPFVLCLLHCWWIPYPLSHGGSPHVRMGLPTLEGMASLGLQNQLPLSN